MVCCCDVLISIYLAFECLRVLFLVTPSDGGFHPKDDFSGVGTFVLIFLTLLGYPPLSVASGRIDLKLIFLYIDQEIIYEYTYHINATGSNV